MLLRQQLRGEMIIPVGILSRQDTIFTIFNFSVIGFTVFVNRFKRNLQKLLLNVGNVGLESSHFRRKSSLLFGLSFDAYQFHVFKYHCVQRT